MLDLLHTFSLFNKENTEIRCRKVLDEIPPVVKPLFKRFIEKIGVPLGNEYIIKNYDSTLSTTYSDSRNQKVPSTTWLKLS